MSAEVLRRAAVRIRHDVEFEQAHGDPTFLLAVADWLDHAARHAQSREDNGESQMKSADLRALRVARAYLNEQP